MADDDEVAAALDQPSDGEHRDEPGEGAADDHGRDERRRLTSHLLLRNAVGIGLALILLVLFVAVILPADENEQIQCEDTADASATDAATTQNVQAADIAESTTILEADLRTRIAVNTGRIADLEVRIEEVENSRSGDDDPVNDETIGDAVDTIEEVVGAGSAATEEIQEVVETIQDAANETQATRLLEAELQSELARVQNEQREDMAALAAISPEDDAEEPGQGDGEADTYAPPRSAVVLAPRDPVAKIHFGSDRDPRRVEIVLEPSNATEGEGASGAPEDAGGTAESVDLPAKPVFLSAAGQFRRSTGAEIPPDQVTVWARRLGSRVLLNVCISPTGSLDAGSYSGDVYLVDPSLNQVRVPVEVTAQSKYLNWLFVLLLVSPALAFAYVWVSSRHLAGADPWDYAAFKKWARENLILSLAIGFGAVWATLAVPFSNPTWGASVLGSLAVVGVGLVAAATAITAVTGRVREPDE